MNFLTPPSLAFPSRPCTSMVRADLTRAELRTLAAAIEREADEARAAGRDHVADRLDWRAADLREAAR